MKNKAATNTPPRTIAIIPIFSILLLIGKNVINVTIVTEIKIGNQPNPFDCNHATNPVVLSSCDSPPLAKYFGEVFIITLPIQSITA